MRIAVTRFESLDKEYDLALTSIAESDPRKIMNAAFNTVTDLTDSLKGAVARIAGRLNISSIVDSIKKAKSSLEAALGLTKAMATIKAIGDAIRNVRGMVKSIFDPSKFSTKQLENYINEIFGPNTQAANFFKKLSEKQRNDALSNVTLGKPFEKTILTPEAPEGTSQTFTLGNQDYDYATLSGLLGQTSGTPYNARVIDNNMVLKKIVTVASVCYNGGVPDTMKTLMSTPDLAPMVRDRAVAIIMTEQATNGNVLAVLDMTKSTAGVIDPGSSPLMANPSIITELMSNMTIPKGMKDNDLIGVADSFLSGMETLDENWNVSADSIPSLKHLRDPSDGLKKIFETKAKENTFMDVGGPDLDAFFDSDENRLASCILANDPGVQSELQQLSSKGSCTQVYCNC